MAIVHLFTPNQIKLNVRKLYFSTLLCYTSKPGYENFSFKFAGGGVNRFQNKLQNVMNQNNHFTSDRKFIKITKV